MVLRSARILGWCLLLIAYFALTLDVLRPTSASRAQNGTTAGLGLESTSIGAAAAWAGLGARPRRFDFVPRPPHPTLAAVLSAPLWLGAGLLGGLAVWASRGRRSVGTRRPGPRLVEWAARAVLVLCWLGLLAALWPPFAPAAATIGELLRTTAPQLLSGGTDGLPGAVRVGLKLPALVVVAALASLILFLIDFVREGSQHQTESEQPATPPDTAPVREAFPPEQADTRPVAQLPWPVMRQPALSDNDQHHPPRASARSHG